MQIQGERPHQEDRFIVLLPGSFKSNKNIALFAVLDGQYVYTRRISLQQVLTFNVVQAQL